MKRRDVLAAFVTAPLWSAAYALSIVPLRALFSDGEAHGAIGQFDEFGAGPFLFDYAKNRAGRLATETKIAMLSTFDASGTPVASVTMGAGGLSIDARRLALVEVERRPFTARNGAVSLSAEVAHRADRKPIGTMLMVYGSGPAPKKALDLWAFHFVARGWAVVTYDKRGSGESQGDWRLASLETLAADARAVIAACPPSPRPFGVWGASQAGWIMPQLAAQDAVDFIVMHAGAATTPGQQILDNVEAELVAYGFPPEEIAKALAYYKLDTDVSRGRIPWSAIDDAHRRATAAKAEWILAPPAAADAPERTFIRLAADFDPAPYWRRTNVPVLALFGSKDVIVPPARNRDLLKTLIPAGTRFHDRVIENANHLFMVADTGVRAEYPKRTAIHPAYFSTIDTWLAGLPALNR